MSESYVQLYSGMSMRCPEMVAAALDTILTAADTVTQQSEAAKLAMSVCGYTPGKLILTNGYLAERFNTSLKYELARAGVTCMGAKTARPAFYDEEKGYA